MKLFCFKYYNHSIGDERVREKFAFFPVTLDNGCVIWLEKYFVKERYGVVHGEYLLYEWIIISIYQESD